MASFSYIPGSSKDEEGLATTIASRKRCNSITSGSAESLDLFFTGGKENPRVNLSFVVNG
jgi:hypothetical protein